MLSKENLLLYLVTDRTWLEEDSLAEVVEQAIQGKVSFVQIREKAANYSEFKEQILAIKKITDKYTIPFVVNDNIQLAIETDVDGVHLGQEDMNAKKARQLLGSDKIIGISVGTVAEALRAEKEGADYLGIGSTFATNTKDDTTTISLATIKKITQAVSIPTVGIGGINEENIHLLKGSDLDGVAVISAILKEKNIKKAAKNLHSLAKENL